ncbi:MAG TPA: Bpu10I family restriction endonuclease [Luteibacter sp.]|uniref:Bpu10I family restriction endonuclease n=1 Tax=Luteibacter sp. TaxID=1886636 RepID=UPI002BC7D040|nr:Bpu10I family restriction endonuclease [Luteibacter sp.]HVI55865.1 Bpu10I family restriction endonuclease [Luteibacter sp.]
MEVIRTKAHGKKLDALLKNKNLPKADKKRVERTIEAYNAWIAAMKAAKGKPRSVLASHVKALNNYKKHVDLELIFDSESDFLYRQKGQLKLDNTILEEFLPYLFDDRLLPGLKRIKNLSAGPHASFAGLSFASPFVALHVGGANIKLKNQDFSVTKSHRMTITDEPGNGSPSFNEKFSVSHFAAEIKTNLDKTMFQEASATAAELKKAVPGSKYILLCEYLDMTPITTKLTSIDEVIVLRKAKRLTSNTRAEFATTAGRKASRAEYETFLDKHPLDIKCFERFVWHLEECFPEKEADAEDIVLGRGYF